jgi:hypothetical protein
MPIKFRCPNCRQFLGISPAKAGELTDCPACGRTVRVPNLDGTVAPMPTARIDHRDQQLAEALSALSQIGTSGAHSAVATAPQAAVETTARQAVAVAPAPVAVAVPVSQPLAAERVEPAEHKPREAEVPTLLFDVEPSEDVPSRPRRRQTIPRELKIAAVVLAAAVVFLAGFFTGRSVGGQKGAAANSVQPSSAPVAGSVTAAVPANDQQVAAVDPPAAATGVSGRVTYAMPSGARPDGGARVIAVPSTRPSAPPLSTAGFRAGAVPAERDRAITTVRATGGDYAIADSEGRYQLQLPAGAFEVLYVSRHVPRDETQPLAAPLSELLASYFDQPAGLVGSVRIEAETIEFDGSALRLDHTFAQ